MSNVTQPRPPYRHFIALVAIPIFAALILVFGGIKNLLIVAHQSRTTATVTEIRSNGRGRAYVLYSYEVDNHIHTGAGAPELPEGAPPLAEGTSFEIRYSTWSPSLSTPHNPFTIFGQFFVGCLFLLWADSVISKNERSKEGRF